MQLLPMPHLQFQSVHVGIDRDAPILVVDEFDMRVELFPLLQGTIEVVDMTLGSPRLTVQLDENGQFAWRQDGGRLWDLDLEKISLQNVSIRDGQVNFEDLSSGRRETLTGVNGTIEARSLVGPYKIESSFQFGGQPYSLMLSSGLATRDGLRVKSLLTPANVPVTLSMDGELKQGDDERLHYVGQSRMTNAIEGLEGDIVPWELSGETDLTASSLTMPSFSFSHGDVDQAYRLDGAGTINFGADPRFDVAVSSRQLDFDRALGDGPNAPIDIKQGISHLGNALVDMPLPPMPGHIAFDVPGVILGGGIIRNLQLDARLQDQSWTVETLEADLPGQTRFAMSGLFSKRLEMSPPEHVFEGEARIRSEQPTAFAKWWLKDTLPSSRLRPFDVGGQLLVRPNRMSVTSLDVDMDGQHAHGWIDWYLGDASEPDKPTTGALSMKLDADEIDLDAVEGIGSLLIANSSGQAAPLGEVSLDVTTDRFQAGDFEGQKLDAKLNLADGGVVIDRLVVEDFAGAYLSVSGALDGLPAAPHGHVDGQVTADDLTGLASLASRFFPDQPVADWFAQARGGLSPADVRFRLEGDTEEQGLKASLDGVVGGGNAKLELALAGSLATWSGDDVDLSVTLSNPDGQKLLGLAGVGNQVLDLPALTATLSIQGVPDDKAATSFMLSSGNDALTYKGNLRFDDRGRIAADGKATLASEDLVPYLMASGIALTNPAVSLPINIGGEVTRENGALHLGHISGMWDEQPVVGDLHFATTLTDRALTGSLELGDLDGVWLGETIVGPGRLTAVDRNWPDTAFVATPVAEVEGDKPLKIELDVKARSLELATPYIFQNPSFGLIWRENGLSVNGFEALLQGGTATGGLQLENVGGEAVLNAHMRLEDASLAPFIWARDGRPVANGQLDVNLTVESQGRSMAGLMSGLTGSGAFTLSDATINYVNPQAFDQVVRAVDAGLALEEGQIADTFLAHMNAGSTKVDSLSGTFNIAGGALRANNIEADAAILQSRGNLMVDLSNQTLNADWSIKVEPNEEDAVTGAQPEVGLVFSGDLEAPERRVDVAPFTGYLSIRAFEREVDRVERLQADILEKERMRRLLRLYRERAAHREKERIAAEEAAAVQEQQRLKQQQLDEEARQAEQERLAEEERQAEQARKLAEQKAREAELARQRAEEEAARVKAAQEEADRLAEEARQAEDNARRLDEQRVSEPPAQPLAPTTTEDGSIEIRPLEELGPAEAGRVDGGKGDATQKVPDLPVSSEETPASDAAAPVRVMPPVLMTLPKRPAAGRPIGTPLNLAPAFPADVPTRDLFEPFRDSPDRIIQLD